MHSVERYLEQLAHIRSTGGAVSETSYYGALETLLNEIGGNLRPRVRCVPQLRNTGAGSPDFGLYAANQYQRANDDEPMPGVLPERGVIEVKGWGDDSFLRAKSDQVTKYSRKYGLVLVTNYRDFVLVGRDDSGAPVRLECYRMAESEQGFLQVLAERRKTAREQGDRLVDFIRRVMLHAARLTDPEVLAWFLASYAREARYRIEETADLPALAGLKNGLEEALGMKFEDEKGDHFFRATLVQTLFYGIFSSWVLWSRGNSVREGRFDWKAAAWTLHVPMIKGLFDQIAVPTKLKPLRIDEVLDWAGAALNRVDRGAFFLKFEEEHAVQYFYEPFLKAYDPQLRKDLGVWYTPPEIIEYQVERVDRVLREELDIADGLADESVVILDPCCGTGAYLVATLRRIHRTLEEKGGSALTAQKLKKAATTRVFGFEILPAPFVIAHLQLGLMLRLLGVPLGAESDERAGVYLTNALTGWEPLQEPKNNLPLFPELLEERDAANKVKQSAPILVVIGNPPYNAFAGTSPEEECGLVDAYKEGLTTSVEKGGWGIKKFNLDDLYVRFFRIAERRIAKSGKGVVSFISNHSYLGAPSFVAMRRELMRGFDKLWFDAMNGDSRETGKVTPDGAPDPSVFSTERSPVGIRVGTAICVLVRKSVRDKTPTVRCRQYWGVSKRNDLLNSLRIRNAYRTMDRVRPSSTNRFSFRPETVGEHHRQWPCVRDLSSAPPTNGLMEKRGGALIDLDRRALEDRMKAYFSDRISDEAFVASGHPLARDAARYSAKKCRRIVLQCESFDVSRIRRYSVRAFDSRWCYYSPIRPLWNEPRPAYWEQCWEGNLFFMTRSHSTASPEGNPFCLVPGLSDDHFMTPDNTCFPIRLRHGCEVPRDVQNGQCVFEEAAPYCVTKANLSATSRRYLAHLGIDDPDQDSEVAGLIWMHALAVGYASAYLSENADGIRQDWPRIPLPATKDGLQASAELGRRVASLLDADKPVNGVTCGKIDERLKTIGVVLKVGDGALDPAQGHLDLSAGWGHSGRDGVCMPGKGRVAIRAQKDEKTRSVFGENTADVYLNDTAYWANIPESVWEYHIGGYQIIKKWLSYREKSILQRGLKVDEVEYVTEMARRIAAIVLLRADLDTNYESAKADAWPWPTG